MDYRTLSPKRIDQLARTIHPGSWAIEPERPLSTLLGSCVAVCLFDPQSGLGGLNHFMLPTIRISRRAPEGSLLSGERAMVVLLEAMLQRGANRSRLQAKAFGGGTIFEMSGVSMDIGLRNATFAKEWLRDAAIPLLASDLLGPWSRKLIFLPDSGQALCRRMATRMATAETIAREEAGYAAALNLDLESATSERQNG